MQFGQGRIGIIDARINLGHHDFLARRGNAVAGGRRPRFSSGAQVLSMATLVDAASAARNASCSYSATFTSLDSQLHTALYEAWLLRTSTMPGSPSPEITSKLIPAPTKRLAVCATELMPVKELAVELDIQS